MKFRMVDKILEWEAYRSIRGVKAVSFEEYESKKPLGGNARLPESLLLESLFQMGNWLIVLSSDFQRMGIVKEFGSVQFAGELRPGKRLSIDVQVKEHDERRFVFDAQGSDGSKHIVQAEGCIFELALLTDYYNPDDLRVLYSEIGPIAPEYSMKS
jgi:3-hydroxymyristoyl/3-hydroxydecanoyl-(acyl carrier protein) dehydratase